ncbi:unnamed protein product [Rhizophagus irregularis]|nr:unnamed protein product [Rhizophagus irregularis]
MSNNNNNNKTDLSITTTTKDISHTTTTIIINSKDEIFLKKILKDFHNKIIKTEDFNNFEKFFVEWMKLKFEINEKDPKKIFDLMKDLKFYYDNNNNNKNNNNNFIWFTSLMGFFYQFGIGCMMNEKSALDLYFLSVNKKNHNDDDDYDDDDNDNEIPSLTLNDDFNNKLCLTEENRNEFNLLKNNNIIIGKYFLSLYYYKDIIIFNTINMMKILKDNEFNIDKQMELQEEHICINNNIIQDSIKKLKSEENTNNNMNNSIINKKKISKKEFENIKQSALKGNSKAQYNLGICYMDGIGTTKNKIKAFEWFLKSENKYTINKNKNDEFNLNLKLAISGNADAQNNLADYYENV